MAKPSVEYPSQKYSDWRRGVTVKRLEGANPVYYITGGGGLLVVNQREFEFLAGIFAEELGRLNRERDAQER